MATTMHQGWAYGQNDSLTAINQAINRLKIELNGRTPTVIFMSATTKNLNMPLMAAEVKKAFNHAPLWGASSALGVIMNNEHDYMKGDVVGLLALCSKDYNIFVKGAAVANHTDDYVRAAESIILAAKANREEIPSLILFTSNPGPHEELILELLKQHFGRNIPIYGGSCGTEASCQRYSIAEGQAYSEGLALLMIYTHKRIGACYQMGFKPEDHRGVATRAEGRRLYEIDGRPALQVYNEWADGFFTNAIREGKSIRSEGQMYHPLAIVKKNALNEELYISLSANNQDFDTGALELFASVAPGDELTILKGDIDSLQNRCFLAVTKAKKDARGLIAGGLVFYCSGARLLLENKNCTAQLGPKLKQAFRDKPFLLMFHNGEHGNVPLGESFHGNLMLDVVVFEE
ncbi:MAG: FIST C-terminal domain-containing protein [Sedimentisphaerales bacterium]|nr:FIST C-terminal domain-containing protein [Sedimentisphaerales bacterium]